MTNLPSGYSTLFRAVEAFHIRSHRKCFYYFAMTAFEVRESHLLLMLKDKYLSYLFAGKPSEMTMMSLCSLSVIFRTYRLIQHKKKSKSKSKFLQVFLQSQHGFSNDCFLSICASGKNVRRLFFISKSRRLKTFTKQIIYRTPEHIGYANDSG